MEDQALFSVMAQCFGPVDEDAWAELTTAPLWPDFLDGVRRALQEDRLLGDPRVPARQLHGCCPLQEFLSVGEVNALFCPPSFAEKQHFSARHFTGGLPESAVPAESLYQSDRICRSGRDSRGERSDCGCQSRGGQGGRSDQGGQGSRGGAEAARNAGGYLGMPARYMQALTSGIGLEVPPAFRACPDHVALELDLVAVLLRSGRHAQARTFFVERFAWLTAYRMRLLELGSEASFYVGLVDVLLGLREQQIMLMQPTAQYEACI